MTSAMTPDALRAGYERIWKTTDMRESQEYYARCLALAEPRAGDRVLDVASGGGYLLMEAERAGLEAHGIDIAQAAIDRAKTFAPKATLVRGDAEALPSDDAHATGGSSPCRRSTAALPPLLRSSCRRRR